MRNRWGVEVKRGHWIMAHGPRGGTVEGRVEKVETRGEFARAYGARVVLDTGSTVGVDDVVQTLGPMKVGRGGVVTQNPLTRVKVGSKSQRTKAAPTKRLRARRRVTEKAPAGFYGNPLARVEVGSPSQRAHLSPRGKMTTKPDARLIKRRTKTAKTRVKGVWANPVDHDDLRYSGSAGVKASKQALINAVSRLATALKMPTGTDNGCINLEKDQTGYMLVQITSAQGAERSLSARLSANEMLMFLDGAALVAKAVR